MQDDRPADDASTDSEVQPPDAPISSDDLASSEVLDPGPDEKSIEAVIDAYPETQEEIDQLLLKRLQSLQRPTWELELLISGAVVFSLFQVPDRLRGWFESVTIHAGPDVGLLPFMGFYALTLVTICLAAAFSLHFVLRSIWVGITGLQSAFPKGIEWDQIDAGPISKRVMREMNPSLEAAEDRLDAVASSIFAVLFTVVVSFVAVFGLMLFPAFLGEILRSRYFPSVPSVAVFYGVVVLVAGPGLPVALIDSWFKRDPSRVDRYPRLYRLAYRVTKIVQFFFLGRLTSPVTLTLSSRFSLKKVTGGLVAAIFLAVAIFMAYFFISMGLIGFDSYTFFPGERGADFVEARYYGDDHIDPRREAPRIQAEVIEDPYIRLFVPFSPSRDDERVARHCPDTMPLRPEGFFLDKRADPDDDQSAPALLACWQQVLVVAIDEVRLSPDWLFHEDPVTGRKGLLAFLPVDGLSGGRHELLVARRPSEEARSVVLRPGHGAFEIVEDEAEARADAAVDEAAGTEDAALASIEVAYRDRHRITFWLPPRAPSPETPATETNRERGAEEPSPGS